MKLVAQECKDINTVIEGLSVQLQKGSTPPSRWNQTNLTNTVNTQATPGSADVLSGAKISQATSILITLDNESCRRMHQSTVVVEAAYEALICKLTCFLGFANPVPGIPITHSCFKICNVTLYNFILLYNYELQD